MHCVDDDDEVDEISAFSSTIRRMNITANSSAVSTPWNMCGQFYMSANSNEISAALALAIIIDPSYRTPIPHVIKVHAMRQAVHE